MNGIQNEKLKECEKLRGRYSATNGFPTTDSGKAGHSIRKLLPLHPQTMK
jgi:hypothetical protein